MRRLNAVGIPVRPAARRAEREVGEDVKINGTNTQGDPTRGDFARRLFMAGGIYLLLGGIGTYLALAPSYASPIFPAAGYAVAVVLSSKKQLWPGIWGGAFVLNLIVTWLHNPVGWIGLISAAGIASGSTLQAIVAAWLIERWVKTGWRTFEADRDILRCLALAGPVPSMISASAGTAFLYAANIIDSSQCLATWTIWWIGDTLGILNVFPLVLSLSNRKEMPLRSRMTTHIIPIAIALTVVWGAFYAVAQWEKSEQKQSVENFGELLSKTLKERFIAHQEVLSSLRRVVEVMPDITYDQFEYFTRITLKDNPDIYALSINPYVVREQRFAYENLMSERTGVTRFEIKESDGQGQLMRAIDRAEYVPVGYIAPLAGNKSAVGYDIYSEPIRRETINRARLSGDSAVTAPIHLVQEEENRIGLLIIQPAYQQHSKTKNFIENKTLSNFVVAVVKVDEMVKIAISKLSNPGFDFSIRDEMATKNQTLFGPSTTSNLIEDDYYLWEKQIYMADRPWTLRVYPSKAYLNQGHSWLSLGVAVAALLLTALLQILLLIITGRTVIVQRKVREQTAEIQIKSDALQDRNTELSAMFKLSPDGFVAFGPDGSIKFANPSFQNITGIHGEYLIGKDETVLNRELYNRCDCPQNFSGIASFFNDTPGGGHALTFRNPRQIALQIIGIQSESSNISRILYFRDVTHEMEIDRMKSEFLATAAHELRTPMASIYGFSELLMSQPLDENTRKELVEIIFNQSELMASILDEFLDLARMEARRGMDFVFKPTAIRTLIDDAVTRLPLPVGRSAPELILPTETLHIKADTDKARQAILNVLSNAYKYSPDGGTVKISVRKVMNLGGRVGTDAAEMVGISIEDSGIGMSEEQVKRVFERFYRADTSGKVPGTGLGMSISKEILTLHHGWIDIKSQLEQGTTVTLWFPLDSAVQV